MAAARATLPDLSALDPEALKALIVAQHTELLSHKDEIEHLQLLITKLRRMMFGRSSEKISHQIEQLELQLEELESARSGRVRPAPTASIAESEPKQSRRVFPDHLPREIETHLPAQVTCTECGGALRKLGEDVSEALEYVPESFKVIRYVRPKFTCAACEHIVQAAAPSRPIERGMAGPGLLAHVLVSKYADHRVSRRRQQPYRCRRTKQEMRVGPSVAAIRSRLQTTACCCR